MEINLNYLRILNLIKDSTWIKMVATVTNIFSFIERYIVFLFLGAQLLFNFVRSVKSSNPTKLM